MWWELERGHSRRTPIAHFEQWVYAAPDLLREALGAAFILELLEFDYRGERATYELAHLIERIFDQLRPGELPRHTARNVAREYLAGDLPIDPVVATFLGLYDGRREWVPVDIVLIEYDFSWMPRQETPGAPSAELMALEERLRVLCREILARLASTEPTSSSPLNRSR